MGLFPHPDHFERRHIGPQSADTTGMLQTLKVSSLDELIAQLRERWPAAVEELPSRSAVHRYGQRLERRLSAIRASTDEVID